MLLYHYTDAKGLYGILTSKKIWASSYRFLNDAKEFEYVFDIISEAYPTEDYYPLSKDIPDSSFAEVIRRKKWNYNYDCFFVASFSEKEDLLGQWRAYTGTHSGYSLGFRSSELGAVENVQLLSCNYDKEKHLKTIKYLIEAHLPAMRAAFGSDEHDNLMELFSRVDEAVEKMLPLAISFKDSSFEAEKEWRLTVGPLPQDSKLIRYRPTEFVVLPYVEIDFNIAGLPLEHIVVGPGPSQERSAGSLRQMLNILGFNNVKITPSKIPYRSW